MKGMDDGERPVTKSNLPALSLIRHGMLHVYLRYVDLAEVVEGEPSPK
jgi:hypothetical protein